MSMSGSVKVKGDRAIFVVACITEVLFNSNSEFSLCFSYVLEFAYLAGEEVDYVFGSTVAS